MKQLRLQSLPLCAILASFLCLLFCAKAGALYVSPAKEPLPIIKEIFKDHTHISEKGGEPLMWTIYQDDIILGYAFETNDIKKLPAYSGEPVNMLVAIDPKGNYLDTRVLEHHEPIILAGIPESKLDHFVTQYRGLSVKERIKVGGNKTEGITHIDGLSGATVTVMVMNVGVTKSAQQAAISLGVIEPNDDTKVPMATVNQESFEPLNWLELTGDGSIRRLHLTRSDIDDAFTGTEAENIDVATLEQKGDEFADIYYTLLNSPSVGKNLLGDSEYQWLMQTLKPGEFAIGLMGNGYSFKGSGYVRGGIFDRIQVHQQENAIAFRDLNHHRITDLYAEGVPDFDEMSIFVVEAHHEFNPGDEWQFELLVRRQLGAIDSVFTSFKGDYQIPEAYVIRPEPVVEAPELTLIEQVWQDKNVEVMILMVLMLVLLAVIFLQDILVRHPTFLHNLRHGFLVVVVVFIGWVWGGQLSVVNVFTFLNALMSDFSWDLFLLDPVIFMLWCAAAVTMILWGRAVYCGWLCPFGALQELVNTVARYFKIPQYDFPYAVHERLWAIKYLILLALFGVSLDSLAMAEKLAEVEPFKTTFLLRFDRELPFILWALFLIFLNLIQRKTFCRYLCPLGAALSVGNNIRLFNWLKRRKECGEPCQTCAKECEIQAIAPNGEINMRECHYCLDCQITYFNEQKCPPLKKLAYKKSKYRERQIPDIEVVN